MDECGVCNGSGGEITSYNQECTIEEVCSSQYVPLGTWHCASGSCAPTSTPCTNYEICAYPNGWTGIITYCQSNSSCLQDHGYKLVCNDQEVCVDVPAITCP